MPATKRGIYHNLKESKYAVSNGEIAFFFSSEIYLQKFLDGYLANRKNVLAKIEKIIIDNSLNMETLADIEFYKRVEKRGFLAWVKGVEITCHDLQKYALRKMTDKNTTVWLRIQKPNFAERKRITG